MEAKEEARSKEVRRAKNFKPEGRDQRLVEGKAQS